MLIRSKSTPLDIELHAPHPDFLRSLTRHSPQISRLALLSLKDGDALQGLLEMEAPALEDLDIVALTGTITTRQPIVVSHDAPVPMSGFRLFHRQSTKLRKISLYNVPIPWLYFPKHTLTYLNIARLHQEISLGTTETPQLGTLDDLLDVIAASPCLEELILKYCLPPVSLQSTPLTRSVIEMPRLHRVGLSGPSSGVLYIFQYLHAPALRDLILLFLAVDQADVSSWPAIASSILSRFHWACSATVKNLNLEVYGDFKDTKVRVRGRSSPVAPAVPSSHFDRTFVGLEFQDHLPASNHDHYQAIWKEVCAALHMGELETLDVAVGVPRTEVLPWTELFGQCANVAEVYAGSLYGNDSSLLQSMTPRDPTLSVPSQELHEPAPVLLFPKLTYITLRDRDTERLYGGGEDIYQIVLELVERRKRCGAPIRELCICSRRISFDEIASLGRFVPKVRGG
ncbi:hypothetical protein BC834DRAFT_974712 [Gloeopeniophorella convolvens]|nr:hypothetical protein BC834DRAFT_974712 [Gloeopeniophorella convolvens]